MYEILKNKIEEGKETVVTALPLYHIFAMNANFFNMIKVGAKNILITNPKNIKEFIKTIKNSKFSLFTGVATLFSAMMNEKSFKKIDFSKLKAVMSGGMSLVEKIASKWENITKVPIIEAYGLTEASPALISNRFDGNHRIGSVGLKLSET
jgi:long-chain acyl-CoA synthetase